MLALDFFLPSHPDALELVGAFAQGLKGMEAGAGQHYILPPAKSVVRWRDGTGGELPGCVVLRVLVPRDDVVYQAALLTLTAVDIWCLRGARNRRIRLREGPFAPLYESGVRYRDEADNQEQWFSTLALYEAGFGDCEDLACARAAERLTIGDHCQPSFQLQGTEGGQRLYHVLIQNPDGSHEDPSARLGMM